jgi:hypothetical protein
VLKFAKLGSGAWIEAKHERDFMAKAKIHEALREEGTNYIYS